MPISPKEIQDSADDLLLDPHFELRLKNRNISLEEVKHQIMSSIPEIENTEDQNKYKVSYQLDKGRYLTLYLLKLSKGLKVLTVFIEKKGK